MQAQELGRNGLPFPSLRIPASARGPAAVDASGASAFSGTAAVTTRATAPLAPSGTVATATSATQVNLSWTDGSGNEAGFRIERSVDNVAFGAVGSVGAIETGWTDGRCTADSQYYYRVQAYNGFGNSAFAGPTAVKAIR